MLRSKKKIELFKYKGCKDCTRNCLWNNPVAIKILAERDKTKFLCNSSKR